MLPHGHAALGLPSMAQMPSAQHAILLQHQQQQALAAAHAAAMAQQGKSDLIT